MLKFFQEYQSLTIWQLPVAKLQYNELQLINNISWSQHIILMQKIKDLPIRFWYLQQVAEQSWSRDTLIV